MPKGLAIPIRATPHGGIQTVEGSANDDKIIRAALGPDENDNAFQQDIGLGQRMIFGIADDALRGGIMERLRLVFERFRRQRRYDLIRSSVRFYAPGDPEGTGKEGEMVLEFRYLSLEANEERLFKSEVSAAGSTGGT